MAAIEALCDIGNEDWLMKKFFPLLNTLLNEKNNYLSRIAGLYCI